MAQTITREPVLVADHHAEDFSDLRAALLINRLDTPLQLVRDGNELIDYLQGTGAYSDTAKYPPPQLLLTEWDLPNKRALEILRWAREQELYSVLPIMVWTRVTVSDAELKEAYHLGLNGFFAKPKKGEELNSLVRLAFEYWTLAEKPVVRRKG